MDGSLPFTNTNYERIDASVMLEEEQHNIDRYLPVKIGQFLLARYLVVGKLGYDMISTTWLARDFRQESSTALQGRQAHISIAYRERMLSSRSLLQSVSLHGNSQRLKY